MTVIQAEATGIKVSTRKDQHVAVFGLGTSGIVAARALIAGGASVTAWDDDAGSRDAASRASIPLADPGEIAWPEIDALVLSPGIALTHPAPHPVARAARAAGRPIIGDIELLVEARPEATYVAVTGTNGKSTTTSLIGHILAASGREVQFGGNLGPPALSLAPLARDGVYVLELSSYQLDLIDAARFDIGVLLNISPDHLDRHGGMDGYVAAKRRLFRDRDQGKQIAIVGVDDEHGRSLAADLRRRRGWRVVPISVRERPKGGVSVIDGRLYEDGAPEAVGDLRPIPTLPGIHNRQNAAAAYAVARALGMAPEAIVERMASFAGLAHRQEVVAVIDGVRYINDSKATNGVAAARALACYDAVWWIAGGIAKEDGLVPVMPHLRQVRHAYLIGRAAEPFAAELEGRVPVTRSNDLASAVRAAHLAAREPRSPGSPEPVVLLSPACASFDQWASFARRGDAFRDIVARLAAEAAS